MPKNLTPSYLNLDYNTLRQKFVNDLSKSDLFKDYDFEGSNTSILIEFVSYVAELNTYYLNKIAKNVYDETADLYENVHRLATFRGYSPKGFISAQTDVTATITQNTGDALFSPGDQLHIPAWFALTNTNGNVPFVTTRPHYGTIPTSASNAYQMSFSVKQGEVYNQTYSGADIIDGQIILPFFQFDHDDDIEEEEKISILLEVNGIPWTRIPDFYDDISGLQSINTVYTFNYDKYQRYNIEFSSSRSIPDESAVIKVTLIKSLGSSGTCGAGEITQSTTGLIYNLTKQSAIPIENITLTNLSATDPGSEPQKLDEIKKAARGYLHAQYRCVSKADYIAFLEARTDIISANAWGEQELYPDGMVTEYNKVHLAVIPTTWGTGTVATSATNWTSFTSPTVSGNIDVPYSVSPLFQQTLRKYLEPRKMLNSYEFFEVPDLIYFAFDIGLRIKRSYNFVDILQDVKNKLTYYFNNIKQFGTIINYLDIHNYILDVSNVSPTDSFINIKGIDNLVFRDIVASKTIHSYNSEYYPQYTEAEFDSSVDNKVKSVQLGFTQYPAFNVNLCRFRQEF